MFWGCGAMRPRPPLQWCFEGGGEGRQKPAQMERVQYIFYFLERILTVVKEYKHYSSHIISKGAGEAKPSSDGMGVISFFV